MSLNTFTRKHDFLICFDSDGCAMDTMKIKHMECFGPTMVEEWGLEEWNDELLQRWNEINLYSATRGVNRFRALAIALREVDMKYTRIEGLEDLEKFAATATELSNETLETLIPQTASICLQKVLNWSRNVNSRISLISMYQKLPFAGVKDALALSREIADVVIVSSANHQAVKDEWEYYGLLDSVDEIFSQDVGSKDYIINELLKKGYEKEKVVMVGDAPGDREAAIATGVHYFPILFGREEECWREFTSYGLKRLQEGRFSETYQGALDTFFLKHLSAQSE